MTSLLNQTLKTLHAQITFERRIMSRFSDLRRRCLSNERLQNRWAVYTQGLSTIDASNWLYQSLLEERLDDLEKFRAEAPTREGKDGMGWIWRSQVQCAVCHRAE